MADSSDEKIMMIKYKRKGGTVDAIKFVDTDECVSEIAKLAAPLEITVGGGRLPNKPTVMFVVRGTCATVLMKEDQWIVKLDNGSTLVMNEDVFYEQYEGIEEVLS